MRIRCLLSGFTKREIGLPAHWDRQLCQVPPESALEDFELISPADIEHRICGSSRHGSLRLKNVN